ncbi:hypothetical protein [Promicromonospora sp. NPDC023805]|uniref:hypothetical protein n=1 Tax=Promicromonospora sp. NPDC023805 TaxID=3154696 RepID=UPI0033E361AA
MDTIDGSAVSGLDVRRPGDAGFDEARTVWNAMVDHRPALIVRCRQADDVVAALALARREGLEVEPCRLRRPRRCPAPRSGWCPAG